MSIAIVLWLALRLRTANCTFLSPTKTNEVK